MKTLMFLLAIYTGLLLVNHYGGAQGSPTGQLATWTEATCVSAGYNAGCCDIYIDECRVSVPGGSICYCDEQCHIYNDCCYDVPPYMYTSQCHAKSASQNVVTKCRASGRDNGCCNPNTAAGCFVPGGSCYCDPVCHTFNDCCVDVVNKQCSSSARVNAMRKINAMMMIQRNDEQKTRDEVKASRQDVDMQYRAAVSNRLQKQRIAARD